jgi:hypothetical protein
MNVQDKAINVSSRELIGQRFAETFFGTLKDRIDLSECETIEEVLVDIDNFLDYYNNYKPKRKMDWLTPIQYREVLITIKNCRIPLGGLML